MSFNDQIPNEKGFDSSIALMHDGYLFIKKRVSRYEFDLFQTNLMMQKVICMSGKEAAKIFYDPELFQRHNATPKRVQKTLFGINAIQSMDGKAHIHRKLLFLSIAAPEEQKRLAELVMNEWQSSIPKWTKVNRITLFDEAKVILCRAACNWAGVPLKQSETKQRAEDFGAMVDAFGAIGLRYQKGKCTRIRTEQWIKKIIKEVRAGKLKPDKNSALYRVSFFQGLNGDQLDEQMASEELINVIRPIVAIANFIVFAALALYEHPECKEKLLSSDDSYLEMFVQEVRRYYPFTPFIGARVKKDFVWNQCQFKKGMLVLLDVYGTDHDFRIWEKPDEFHPDRFKDRKIGLFDYVPQGGGDPAKGHRCPGEGITIEIMKTSIDFLVNKIEYEVPDQDLSYCLGRIPTFPKSGLTMNNIRPK